jgi:hypothetical protein
MAKRYGVKIDSVRFCVRLADQAGEQFMEEDLIDNGCEKDADGGVRVQRVFRCWKPISRLLAFQALPRR